MPNGQIPKDFGQHIDNVNGVSCVDSLESNRRLMWQWVRRADPRIGYAKGLQAFDGDVLRSESRGWLAH